MRIAHIGSRGIPTTYSGVEKIIEETSRRLTKQGFEITVYCHSRNFKVSSYCDIKLVGLPTINTKHLATLVHSFLSTLYVIFTNAQIVHYHCLGPSIFSFLPRLIGKKTIVTVHALDWKRKKWKPMVRFLLKLCEVSALYFPNKTIVVSKHLQYYFKQKYNKTTVYIPNGLSIIKNREVDSYDNLKDYILFVGRLTPEKGVHYLIRAFNKINTNKELWIVGHFIFSESYFKKLKEIAGSNVKFLEPVYGKNLNALYQNAYLFVLPSEIEGCPVTLLEAMSNKKCALTSDIPECLEIISNCGISFKNRDELDLVEKLQYLLKNPDLVEKLGEKAHQRVNIKYSIDIINKSLSDIYHSLTF